MQKFRAFLLVLGLHMLMCLKQAYDGENGFQKHGCQMLYNQLVIRGRITDGKDTRMYLHRGIASRQFQRSFILAEGIEVSSARLKDGLLHIDMTRPFPEPKVKKITIEKELTNPSENSTSVEAIELEVND